MAFDAKEYRNRVLSQYSRAKEPAFRKALAELKQNPSLPMPSQFDLAEFYDIADGRPDVQIAVQIDEVASAIKLAVQKPGGSRLPLEFHELIVARNPGLKTSAFWVPVFQRRGERAKEVLAQFGENVEPELSALGVVTARQLRDLAKGAGVSETVSDADLARLVEASGVAVVPELPVLNAPAQVLREVSVGLKKTSARSILSVIFLENGEPASFSILDGLRATHGTFALTLATLTSAYAYAQRLPDNNANDAMQKILGAIKGAAKSDAELNDIVVAYFVGLGQQIFNEVGMKRGALNEFVARTGIDAKDAGRILLSVSPTGGGQQRSWQDVQGLIASGGLKEARRLYETMFAELGAPDSEPQKQALAALDGTERKVQELRKRAAAAQTAGDLETAAKALDEALTICSDDESLAAAARALPPAAPVRFTSAVSDNARVVKLSWEPGFGSSEDVQYHVIRKAGSAPSNNADGTVVGSAIVGTVFEDSKLPVATALYYGVSASRGGGASPVAIAQVMALPPVTDVAVTSDLSSVTLRWTTPPEARSIEIVQSAPDGTTTTLRAGSQSGTTSPDLTLGATYTFLVTAVYTGTAGETLKSATVRVTGVPRGTASTVTSVTIRSDATVGAKPELSLEWPSVAGYPVEIWHYAQKPSWLPGARLLMSEVRAKGTQLAGRALAGSPGREGVRGSTLPGLRYYAAITRDGEFGLVGQVQPHGSAPAIQNVRAERFGGEVVLSWDWPGPEYDVRVRWGEGVNSERTIGMNKYQTEGGCRVPLGAAGGTIALASVAGDAGQQWVSQETLITIPGTAVTVEYDVEVQKKLFGPPSGAIIQFSVPAASAPFEVVVVGHYSTFMPFDASQGSVLKQVVVSADSPQVIVTLPAIRKGPLWIRAFSTGADARLIDPPTSRMKVS